ncbi:hypothetical protein [Crocinitomix catalasitica]|uniref:hypothetical protein n=1 Tax=Crocinitomix catalasitica TaxID=184607 RepID=UPI000487BD17|nr:hypothetical protein [Crocinitomix catalasitica]
MIKTIQIACISLCVVTSCGTTEEVAKVPEVIEQSEEIIELVAPVDIVAPYAQKLYAGQQDGINVLVLKLPIQIGESNVKDLVELDSVYFRGYFVPLEKKKRGGNLIYQATINISKTDHVPVAPPYRLKDDEAIVTYRSKAGYDTYFEVESIEEKEAVYMP